MSICQAHLCNEAHSIFCARVQYPPHAYFPNCKFYLILKWCIYLVKCKLLRFVLESEYSMHTIFFVSLYLLIKIYFIKGYNNGKAVKNILQSHSLYSTILNYICNTSALFQRACRLWGVWWMAIPCLPVHHESSMYRIKACYYTPDQMIRGILFLSCPCVCLFVANFHISSNFWTVRDKTSYLAYILN